MRKTALTIAATAMLATGVMAAPASAELNTLNLKVVGTWGNLSNWKEAEGPLWDKTMPEASGGKITADALPQTELGIKGFEVMRLLKIGVFDVAHGVVGYIAGEDPVAEGVDLAGVIQNWDDAKAAFAAYPSDPRQTVRRNLWRQVVGRLSVPQPDAVVQRRREFGSRSGR